MTRVQYTVNSRPMFARGVMQMPESLSLGSLFSGY